MYSMIGKVWLGSFNFLKAKSYVLAASSFHKHNRSTESSLWWSWPKKAREYEITMNDQWFINGEKSNEQMMIGSFSRHTFSSVCDIHLSVTFNCFLYLQFKPTNRYKSQKKLINFN